MRSSQLLLILVVFGVSVILAAATACADISNVTTNTLLFAENYESAGNGVSHAAFPDTSGAYLPTGGAPGNWSFTASGAAGTSFPVEDAQVTDHVGGGDPGAYQGSNYLRITRIPSGAEAFCTMNFPTQSTPGDVIHWDSMIYVADDHNPLGILGNGGLLFNLMANWDSGRPGVVHSYTGAWPPTDASKATATYATGVWQKWEIDYTTGNADLTLSIDGVSSVVPIRASGDLALSNITLFSDNTNHPFYVDASTVPEPGTAVMLTAGLIGLLAYAWRKRK
jgi:hypothetical protein